MSVKHTLIKWLDIAGMGAFKPLIFLLTGENPKEQLNKILRFLVMPIVSFGLFLFAWFLVASNIETKYGNVPTPREVVKEAGNLIKAHRESRAARKAFYREQAEKATEYEGKSTQYLAQMGGAAPEEQASLQKKADKMKAMATKFRERKYADSPTYLDQIMTSLKTVFAGFVIATMIAVPIGILCGLSETFMASMNPLIQIFKPVSPLAWLPIVMIIVGALYTTNPQEAWFEKSFISSAITVALCSLWPTLVNTALGVASIDKDHLNVARVLKLGAFARVFKIIIPSSLPLMFTGLRISLGVGWMVLIAAEMLAQNPGLGKFVWDMYQNGSSQTLAQIMVAVFTIGLIGFSLDRIMVICQRLVSFDTVVSA